jgi:hypothetical protein
MKTIKRHWRPSPTFIVISTASFIILLMFTLSWLAARRNRLIARVEIADPLIEASIAKSTPSPSSQLLPDGEVERTALRVREVSALVMGLSLLAINEGLNRRPITNIGTLTERFVSRGLLPPGVEGHNSAGVLASSHAVIYVRYRPDPFGIEVLSLGRERADGPAIIGRIATADNENAEVSLFIAQGLSDVAVPLPFTPSAQIAAMSWSVEPLRERAFENEELEKVSAWLKNER